MRHLLCVGGDKRGLVAGHDAQRVLEAGRVAAEQAVVPQVPQVAELRDGDDGRLVGAIVG